jgi:hypothetical protein
VYAEIGRSEGQGARGQKQNAMPRLEFVNFDPCPGLLLLQQSVYFCSHEPARPRHALYNPKPHDMSRLIQNLHIQNFKSVRDLSIGAVKNALSKNFKSNKAVGIIDNDKKKPADFAEFILAEEKEGLQRRLRTNALHTLLVINPAFEYWVFENARLVNVNPEQYGFHSPKYFRTMCKKENAGQHQPLKNFLNTLKQKNAPSFVQLTAWICEGADIDLDDL